MLKVVHDADASNENAAGGSLLDELVRGGARAMLAAALQSEVAAYVEAFVDQLDENGRRLVVRNGHHDPREVDAETGERKRFASAILPAWIPLGPAEPDSA